MFFSRDTVTILGVRMHAAQSNVGNVLSNWAIRPPIEGSRSTMTASYPANPTSMAAWIPEIPPPMTSALFVTGILDRNRGLLSATLARAMSTRSSAFSVASSRLSWTQEHCSRMLAISTMYGFSPSASTQPRNVGSCRLGEHAATTIRSSPCSSIASAISLCPGSEHMYL